MRRGRSALLGLCVLLLVAAAGVRGAGPTGSVAGFYGKYPRLADFFPFGVYGGKGSLCEFGQFSGTYARLYLDILSEHNLNAIWDGSTTSQVILKQGRPVLTPFGAWYYGEELRQHGVRVLPCLTNWTRYTLGPFAKLQRDKPLADAKEMAAAQRELAGVLAFARELAKRYPETVVGYVVDDEPHKLAPTIAAVRLVEKHARVPATACSPHPSVVQRWAKHIDVVTGDWYPTWDCSRDSWSIARNLRQLRQQSPNCIFWFIPLANAYSAHELTKPGLRDPRPSRAELRLQFWQAVALGCKGFFYYSTGHRMAWAGSEGSLLNVVLRPETGNDLMGELRELGQDITAIGPLLLACRADLSPDVNVACGRVRFPEFEGPAIDVGLLRDTTHDRCFLVPWNNDIRRAQSGRLHLPAELLQGREVYRLRDLEKAALDGKGTLAVSLPSGGGDVFLLGSPKAFAACRDTILRHRASRARVHAWMKYRIVKANDGDLGEADRLLAAAGTAERARQWAKAHQLYTDVVSAVEQARRASLPCQWLHTPDTLGTVATYLSRTDELLSGYRRVLGLTQRARLVRDLYKNPHVGKAIQEWVFLTQCYVDAQAHWRLGEMGGHYYHHGKRFRGGRLFWGDFVPMLRDKALANFRAVKAAVEARLKEVRRPFRVALVTPVRDEMESILLYSWLLETCHVWWIAPRPGEGTGKRRLVDRKGKAFDPGRYDVVWVHQLRYAHPPVQGKQVDPNAALMPELTDRATLKAVRAFVKGGGGLLLSGVAGLYTMPLGVEKVSPDRLDENSYQPRFNKIGLKGAPGSSKHPILAGLPKDGFHTNGNTFVRGNLIAECVWESRTPTGLTVANELGIDGRADTSAAIVEYRHGSGKIVVLGGRACDQTPGMSYWKPGENDRIGFRTLVRRLTLNALAYLAGKGQYKPDRRAAARSSSTRSATTDGLPRTRCRTVPQGTDRSRPLAIDWRSLGEPLVMSTPQAARAAIRTDVWIARDATHLYVTCTCHDPDPKRLKADVLKRDGPVYGDDAIEVFVSAHPRARTYRHLAVNSRGVLFDAAVGKGGGIDPTWTSHARVEVRVGPREWQVSVAIPFADVALAAPKAGETWRVNVCREFPRGPDKLFSWSPTMGGFHVPGRFGYVTF